MIRGTHPYAYRSGEWAEITGVEVVVRPDGELRPCYRIRFPDGATDLCPVYNSGYEYEFAVTA